MAKKGTTRHASDKQEARIQKQFGGWRPPNSGAGMFKKGDNILDDFYIDGKTSMTEVTQKTIKKAELEEARKNAFAMRRQFHALAISFGDGKDFFVLPADDMEIIYSGYKQREAIMALVGGDADEHILDDERTREIKKILRGDL